MPVFEYTLRAAGLKNPAPNVALYAKVAQSDATSTEFMDVLAGTIPFKDYFNPANVSRLLTS
jgi:hypothetical protein